MYSLYQACRIGALILFSVNPLSLFGTVGLLSCSAVHPGFQEVPSRHVLYREDLDTGCFHCSTATPTLLSIQSLSAITPVDKASMHPCYSTGLHVSRIILPWSRSTYSIPSRPGHSRSISCVVVAMLQLCGDVECNPGPSSPAASNIRFRYINKSVLIHEFVSDHSLDVLALSETRYYIDVEYDTE